MEPEGIIFIVIGAFVLVLAIVVICHLIRKKEIQKVEPGQEISQAEIQEIEMIKAAENEYNRFNSVKMESNYDNKGKDTLIEQPSPPNGTPILPTPSIVAAPVITQVKLDPNLYVPGSPPISQSFVLPEIPDRYKNKMKPVQQSQKNNVIPNQNLIATLPVQPKMSVSDQPANVLPETGMPLEQPVGPPAPPQLVQPIPPEQVEPMVQVMPNQPTPMYYQNSDNLKRGYTSPMMQPNYQDNQEQLEDKNRSEPSENESDEKKKEKKKKKKIKYVYSPPAYYYYPDIIITGGRHHNHVIFIFHTV